MVKRIIFAKNLERAREYIREKRLGSSVRKARKQVHHIAGWKTYSYK